MSRGERLNRLLRTILPDAAGAIETGEWGAKGAPYTFDRTTSGDRRLRIRDDNTGEVVAAVGATHEDVFDKLEKRFNISA